MTDDELIEWLLDWGRIGEEPVLIESASRIKKLQAALREIIDRAEHRMGHAVSDDVCAIAREALEGENGVSNG